MHVEKEPTMWGGKWKIQIIKQKLPMILLPREDHC